MMDTMKSATAWLTMRIVKLERSFFSYLYDSRTSKFDAALTAAKMSRSAEMMMMKMLMLPLPDKLETVVIPVKFDVEFSSCPDQLLAAVVAFASSIVVLVFLFFG